MKAPWESSTAERQSRARGPENAPIDDSIAASEDLLFDFFDFFDKTIDDVYAYILHRTRVPEVAEDITLNVYFSLLQRRRFFWWRNVAELSTLIPIADKAIAAMPKWTEDATETHYIDTVKTCVPDGSEESTLQKLELLLTLLRSLSVQEQKNAVMRIFLHWPAKKAASILEKNIQNIEKEYEAVLHKIIGELGKETVFSESSVEKFLDSIHSPSIDKSLKVGFRVTLLEKYRNSQMSDVRFVAPAIAMVLFFTITGYTAFSTFMLPSVSALESKQQIAAAKVLLLEHELAYRDVLIETNDELRGVTAYFAEKDLARISLELAPYAVNQQVELEQEVGFVLRKMGEKVLISAKLFEWPKAFARSH